MSDMPPPPPPDSPSWSSELPSQPSPAPGGQAYLNPQAMTGWTNLGTGGTVQLASPGARLGARVLDAVIMLIAVAILTTIGVALSISTEAAGDEAVMFRMGAIILAIPVFAAIGIAYEVVFIALKGQTLGKMAVNIKVIRADNGLVPGWGKSIGRWILPAALGIVPFVGWIASLLVYISLTWDRVRQGWHDKAAATLVVKV